MRIKVRNLVKNCEIMDYCFHLGMCLLIVKLSQYQMVKVNMKVIVYKSIKRIISYKIDVTYLTYRILAFQY